MSTPFPSRSEMISGKKKKKSKKPKTVIENLPNPYGEIEGVNADGTSVCPIYVSDFEDSSEVAVMCNYKYQDFVTKSLPVVARGRPEQPREKETAENKPFLTTQDKKANKRKYRLEMKKKLAQMSRSKSREKKTVHVDVTALEEDPTLERELEDIALNWRPSGLISGTPEKAAFDVENGRLLKSWKKVKWGKNKKKKLFSHKIDGFQDEDDEKSWIAGTLTKESPSEKRRSAKTMTIKMVSFALLLLSIVLISVGIAQNRKNSRQEKPLTEKEQQIQNIMVHITGEKTLTEPGTAQNSARNWLLYEDKQTLNSPVSSEEAIIQRFALACLYFATNGDGGENTWLKNKWLKGLECGDENHESWEGIDCNADGEVQALSLDDWGLSGSIPAEVGHLYKLESLILKNNPHLTGWIPPSLSHLGNLRQLGLYNNNLSGVIPDIFEHTKFLKFINLENNDIHGSIPLEISHLASLETLVLKNNRMEGIIPFKQLASTNIKYLGLSNNHFASIIETEIMEVDTLEYIYLDNNSLTGTVPKQIGSLSHLKAIDFGNNSLTGFFPGTVGNLERLEYLSLNNNKFSSHLPYKIRVLTNLSKYASLWCKGHHVRNLNIIFSTC